MFNQEEDFFYPDLFEIRNVEFKGQINKEKGTILIPCADCPEISDSDSIYQIIGNNKRIIKISDYNFRKGGSLGTSENNPNMLTLYIDTNSSKLSNNITIGSISGSGIQVGNSNNQNIDVNLQQLVQEIANSEDEEAKNILRKLFENSTVASLIGVGVASLITYL